MLFDLYRTVDYIELVI